MLLPVHDAEQQCYHEGIDQDRYNNVFRSLFDIPTSLLVGLTGITRVNPGKEWRTKCDFPEGNYAYSQRDRENDEECYYLIVKPFHRRPLSAFSQIGRASCRERV